jgi:hypothetical protein
MSPPPEIDALSLAELKSLVLELLAERTDLLRTAGTLRDEIARLKGGPGRPDIKPNVKPDIKLRIPTKPATYSNRKPATCSDPKPAGIPISSRPPCVCFRGSRS